MKNSSMSGTANSDTEKQAGCQAEMKPSPSYNVMPVKDNESCKTSDGTRWNQLSDKTVKPFSDKVTLVSAVLVLWVFCE